MSYSLYLPRIVQQEIQHWCFFRGEIRQFKIITEGKMVRKRKANQVMEKIAKMAKESEEEKNRSEK